MSLFGRMLASMGYEPRRDPTDLRWWGGNGGNYSATGVAVTDAGAMQLDVVQAAMDAIAGPMSSLPVMVIERISDDESAPRPDHAVSRLLANPNPRQSSQEFRDELARNLVFYRNVYIQFVQVADDPIGALDLIHPRRKKKIEVRDGRFYYTFRNLEAGKADIVLRDDQLCHIRKPPLTDDGLEGIPIHETGLETIGRAIAVKQYGARFFKNSGRSGGVLEHPGKFGNKEDQEAFLETWRGSGTGENAHKDRLLLYGVKYQPLDVQNDQAQFIETMKEENAALCRVMHNIQQHRVQILDRSTNNNIEQQSIEFVAYVLGTFICAIQEALCRDLFDDEDRKKFSIEFNVLSLLSADTTAQFAAFSQARQWGWLSANEIRKRLHLNRIPNGDEYLRPMNMVPAGTPPTAGIEPVGDKTDDPSAP
jgi:HK97 family phage portal protein